MTENKQVEILKKRNIARIEQFDTPSVKGLFRSQDYDSAVARERPAKTLHLDTFSPLL